MAQYKYRVVFHVNGRRTEAVVSASDPGATRELIRAQYAGQKVLFDSVRRA